MELRVYLDFLRRRWWLVALGPVLAGLAAYFVSQSLTPMYRSTATVLVDRKAQPGVIDYNDILSSERLTNTYAQLVERPAVLDEVIKRLSLPITRGDLQSKIDVTPIKETQLLSLSVTDADPVLAATVANTTAQVFAEDNASQFAPAGTVRIARPAEASSAPVSPKVMFNVAFALILGGIVSAGLALLLDYLDDTVKTSEDIEVVAGLPTLGMIGRFRAGSGPATTNEQHTRSAEAYRQLRTNVHFTTLGSELKTIVVTSSNPAEGKSTTAANLATVLAQAGDRVILVDTDLRRSSLRSIFNTPASIGLTGLLLSDSHDTAKALVATRWENLQLLPSGVMPPNPSELLTSAHMMRVIQSLRQMADYVIFDTPPILAVTDAIVLAARTDGTILVAESGGTRTDSLRQAARTLKQANARVLGVVLNKAKTSFRGDYYYTSEDREPVSVTAEAPRTARPVAEPALVQGEAQVWQEALASLRRRRLGPGLPQPVMSSNGHAQANGHSNGNGGAAAGTALEAAPLSAAMTDLLSHLDDTVGLIRSLKPIDRDGDRAGL
ncbi:MAG TPA: polysaccharide biosynthesis tyrosine autokinase [Dehalococcoidia bacterium]|nr:polysaccharide biosynthesis tyrosine autokinase [Dehalococcoidia bacterium]